MDAGLARLLRPRQWYKNAIVFVPLLFSGHATDLLLWPHALVAFGAFCLLAGATYAVNDVLDRERDRLHPRKRHRPVASGAVGPRQAVAVALVAAASGLVLLWLLNPTTFLSGLAYLVLQAAYNGLLKQVVIWDALAVAGGFVLRALAGTTALEIGDPTEWLVVCTFLFAFYLALAKRRHERLLSDADPEIAGHRATLQEYSPAFLEQTMQVATALLLTSYSLYTFFGTTNWMMFTLPFAYYGIFRHNLLVHRRDVGDEAEMIFRDRPTMINAAAWVLVVVLVLAGIPQDAVGWLEALRP